ncbi:Alanine racemase, biosynthetic [Serratia liquefaciens]|jgi:alanine racemase|uniref:alanine racemase n=1 Tax=Serratia TaxID=613 RepID=UPI0003586279|nr:MULTISPECIES: alanine racemase [Serratia]AGQ33100.1 alanine racemase [Serratia liquefaciens ATCC 27592]MBF8107068.1 alanine racemase [Serratia liquefaciens]MCE9937876.1 alanine racemase [Serratia liquefaciens]MCS4318326.1 alanine racemase [Serratia sp. BIGb0234]MDU3887826.1 alanine racemase [Serratia liquefaciens]
MKAATAVIDRRALRHNLQQVRRQAPQSRLIAVVKANAYGHGLLETAHTLQDADCYGVARIGEALKLRSGGIVKPILMLEGFFSAEDLPVLVANNIETAVHSIEQLEALEQATLARPVPVWMKLDTGMHRLGVRPEHAEAFYQRLSACRNVVQPVNIMSHFSRADEPSSDATLKQMQCFEQFARGKPGQRSIAASGGTLLWPDAHNDWVRPGIILYGVSPMEDANGSQFDLQPAMTLKSNLIAVREHKAGESVGYGGTWVSEGDTRLGVVAMGYGDGYPRSAPSGTPVWLNGREVPIVGRVSMDMMSVDLGPNATDKVGDEVVLWGRELPVERIAECTGISAYELITKLTQRVAMEYIGE